MFRVRHRASGEVFAVKRSRRRFRSKLQRERCLREIRAVAALPAHPNIVNQYRAWQVRRSCCGHRTCTGWQCMCSVCTAGQSGMLLCSHVPTNRSILRCRRAATSTSRWISARAARWGSARTRWEGLC